MIAIFNSDATTFTTLGNGVLKDFTSAPLITEVLNGEYTLEFTYAKNGILSEQIIEGNIIKANGQPFRIWNIKKDTKEIKVLAKHIFFDLSKNFLEDVAPTDKTADQALAWILDRTVENNNFTVTGDCTAIASARYVRVDPITALYSADNAILERFGGEIELNGYTVTVHQQRGSDLGLEIRQGKNLNGIEFNLDFSTVATKVMPQGANELLLPELYVESPLVTNYFVPFIQKVEFNDIKIDVENGITEEAAQDMLRDATEQLFNAGLDKPSVSVKINFIELAKTAEYTQYQNLETAHLGDTCKAYIPALNLNFTTRIVKTVFNCALNRIIELELGTPVPDYVAKQSKSLSKVVSTVGRMPESILGQAQDNATQLINHPFGGYIYISEDTGELYLMDTNDLSTAELIWKFGLGGIGFSNTGINGTYTVAITQDGQIVADFITTGTMSVSRIQGLSTELDKITQLEINQSGISATVADLSANTSSFVENLALVQSQQTQLSQTAAALSFTVTEIVNNGVTRVSNTMFTLDDTGLSIAKDSDEFNALMDNKGLYLNQGESLVAQYDKDGATISNLEVLTTTKLGNLQITGVIVGGEKRTYIHTFGGEN